ncbi:hypothetical protein FRC08_009682 [Ceratobasidium sp. 394]|nr:hypothetical protein FRC08_009682 [Ceratobasidium sp. 394]KAG9089865.1 hypothetical protein FS749_000987 [Ceratobasidium sp. UAMH 11750]
MAYYNYYRQYNPSTWGTNDYVFGSPPAPRYQPQPQWRGSDYYRAHNDGIQDSSAFEYVWNRMKSRVTGTVSRREAQSWHRRVYGGLTDVATMLPTEIGAAAGYEAWRFFDHHRGIYRQPLMDDRERETEALVGLAVGEAEKLLTYTNRRGDKYGKRESLETAAAVAMKLYHKGNGSYPKAARFEQPYGQESYLMPDSRYPRHRRSSSASPYGTSSSDDLSDYERDRRSEYSRSPRVGFGTPSVMTSGLPGSGIPIPDSYSRRRASSSSYHTRPPVLSTYGGVPIAGSALSTSPGNALMLPSSSHHHHSSSFGGYTSNGLPIHRTTYGDPTSEYGHLPPGTYMITGGSSGRRKHRKSHSGVRYVI